ncbi:MAG: DUF1049 domain-containing protein [Rhizobiales bacterium]|nr:DUF1049 domain-containing protein [Hyphomicrobiales bacterium]
MKLLILIPVGILVIFLSVANRDPVLVSLNPLTNSSADAASSAFTYSVPLYLVLFLALLIGIVLGGLGSWFAQGKWRKKARDEKSEANKYRQRAEDAEKKVLELSGDSEFAHPLIPAPKP